MDNADSTLSKIGYGLKFIGQGWSERIDGYGQSQAYFAFKSLPREQQTMENAEFFEAGGKVISGELGGAFVGATINGIRAFKNFATGEIVSADAVLGSGAGSAAKGARNATRMTTKQATAAAKELGYEPTNYVAKSGEKVFYNKKTKQYISQDVGSGNGIGSHNGGVWKAAKSPEALNSKETRLGTYDANMNRIGD